MTTKLIFNNLRHIIYDLSNLVTVGIFSSLFSELWHPRRRQGGGGGLCQREPPPPAPAPPQLDAGQALLTLGEQPVHVLYGNNF